MSSLLPEREPLSPPAGLPAAVEDAAHGVASAARLLDEMADRLTSARTPGWHGADADAAEFRRDRIARLAGDSAEALYRAALRLLGHADVLREVCARTAILQAAQDEEFAAAGARIAVPFDPADPLADDPADVLDALRVADVRRAAEHRALASRLADDAAETVRVLAACTAVVSGSSRYDTDLAMLRLAALLPAWGTPEVARRGSVLAGRVREGTASADDLVADLDLAADPAYAAAFLAGLTPGIVSAWLATAWGGAPADDPGTEHLAKTLSGLDREAAGPSWLRTLLDDAFDDGGAEGVVGGVGAVLARARAIGLAGPPPALAAGWARSLIREERAAGQRASVGTAPAGADPRASDPLELLVETLVEQRAAVETAGLMSEADAWTVLLSRGWTDGGVLRNAVLTTVADAPAEAARPALRVALVSLGTGLEDGDPDGWPLVEEVVVQAVPALTAALLRHPDVLRRPLAAVAAGTADAVSVTALRGLAVSVALDATVDGGTRGRLRDQVAAALARPHPGALLAGSASSSVAVPAAFVAIREYGARLAHAMAQHRLRDEAEAREFLWSWTFGIPFTVLGSAPVAGRVSGALETVVTRVLGTDGHFENTADRGEHLTAVDAVAGAIDGRGTGVPERVAAEREAVLAFAGTIGVLGKPVGAVAPDEPLLGEVVEALAGDVLGGAVTKRLGIQPPFDAPVGDVLVDGGGEVLDSFD